MWIILPSQSTSWECFLSPPPALDWGKLNASVPSFFIKSFGDQTQVLIFTMKAILLYELSLYSL